MQQQCSGTTKQNERCKSFAMPDSPFCLAHNPDRVTDLAEYRRQGGRGRSHEARARKRIGKDGKDAAWLRTVVFDAIESVQKNEMDHKRAGAIANLARVGFVALGVTDFAQMLADLRRELGELGEDRSA